MKTLAKVIMITAVMSGPVFADSHHPHGTANKGGGMMGMMSHEQMQAMHQHMEEMQALMANIQQESDPEKRKALMQAHMKDMQEGMQMMGGQGGMGSGSKDMSSMGMEERMGMMEKHMSMMQMMMGQMMEHDVEEHK